MIITCQACQKRYLIENHDIGVEGRQVKCVSCGHLWQQDKIDENPNIISLKSLTFDPGYKGDIRKKKNISWLACVAGFFFFIVMCYLAREPIVAKWPGIEKIFSAFKIPVAHPHSNLILENVQPIQIERPNGTAYALKGELVNEGREVKHVPALEILAQGDCRYAGSFSKLHHLLRRVKANIFHIDIPVKSLCVLETWTYHLTETRIFPGEKLAFETPQRAAVTGVSDITIEF